MLIAAGGLQAAIGCSHHFKQSDYAMNIDITLYLPSVPPPFGNKNAEGGTLEANTFVGLAAFKEGVHDLPELNMPRLDPVPATSEALRPGKKKKDNVIPNPGRSEEPMGEAEITSSEWGLVRPIRGFQYEAFTFKRMSLIRALVVAAAVSLSGAIPLQAEGQKEAPLFAPASGSPLRVGRGPGKIVHADLTRDGHLDLVIQHLLTFTVSIFLGDGNGHFTLAPGSPRALDYPGDIAVGDVNHDGWPDLAIARGNQDSVDVLLGDGTGQFHRAPGSPFIVDPAIARLNKRSLHMLDLNGDGNLDFVTANGRNNTFATLLGDGKGGFSPGPITRVGPEDSLDFRACAFGDVDGDGSVDLVISSSRTGSFPGRGSGSVELRLGEGSGAFPHSLGQIASVPPGPLYLFLGDLGSGGRADLAISHSGRFMSVFRNGGNGVYAPARGSPYTLVEPATQIVIADVSRDGRNDLIAATVDSVTVLLATAVGGFVPAPGSPYRAGPGCYFLAIGDIDEDGKLDIVASSFEGDTVAVLLGQ